MRKHHHLSILSILTHCSFLSYTPQTVRMRTATSSTIITNTGAPQSCVLSPEPSLSLSRLRSVTTFSPLLLPWQPSISIWMVNDSRKQIMFYQLLDFMVSFFTGQNKSSFVNQSSEVCGAFWTLFNKSLQNVSYKKAFYHV